MRSRTSLLIQKLTKFCRQEDDLSRERALQTVAAGQKAENLLDFDDDPTPLSSDVNVVANSFRTPDSGAAPKNPLDDLLGLFANDAPGGDPKSRSAKPYTSDLLGDFF